MSEFRQVNLVNMPPDESSYRLNAKLFPNGFVKLSDVVTYIDKAAWAGSYRLQMARKHHWRMGFLLGLCVGAVFCSIASAIIRVMLW